MCVVLVSSVGPSKWAPIGPKCHVSLIDQKPNGLDNPIGVVDDFLHEVLYSNVLKKS